MLIKYSKEKLLSTVLCNTQ